MDKDLKCVYVLEMSNNTIKIGVSNNVKRRILEISSRTGLKVINSYNSKMIERKIAFDIERECHNYFSSNRVKGEFFNVSFTKACAELQKLVNNQIPNTSKLPKPFDNKKPKTSKSQRLATARYREKTYERIVIDVRKGKKDRYKEEAAKRGLSLAMLIQKGVEEFIENHQPDSE